MAVIDDSRADARLARGYAQHRMAQALAAGLITPAEAAAFRGHEIAWWTAFSVSPGFHQAAGHAGWQNPGAWLDHGAPKGAAPPPGFHGPTEPGGITTGRMPRPQPQGMPAAHQPPQVSLGDLLTQPLPHPPPVSGGFGQPPFLPPAGAPLPGLQNLLLARKRRRTY